MRPRRWLLVLAALWSCDTPTDPPIAAGASLELTHTGLPVLDAALEGSYEAWVIDAQGLAFSAGRFAPGGSVTLTNPVSDVRAFEITIEPPGDGDDQPSGQRLLRGAFRGGRADLEITGAVTQGELSLRQQPGTFTMFSPSNNAADGYPSHEESGIWLFNVRPRETPQNDAWVRLTQIQSGWTYQGWMVRDVGAPDAIWLSYGKFRPDQTGAVSGRDDTGWGPFSGVTDFLTAGEEEFPGDDWISNPLNYPFPAALSLPLDLREQTAGGASRWTHVITIEPATNRGEAIGSERPFFIRPYYDPFGGGGPAVPRMITFHGETVPHGRVDAR
ncbi:MAG TPA: anti-sigma factor [Gemmatimonadales bacterium]